MDVKRSSSSMAEALLMRIGGNKDIVSCLGEQIFGWKGDQGMLAYLNAAVDQRIMPRSTVHFFNVYRAVCCSWWKSSIQMFREWSLAYVSHSGEYAFIRRELYVIVNPGLDGHQCRIDNELFYAGGFAWADLIYQSYPCYSLTALMADPSLMRDCDSCTVLLEPNDDEVSDYRQRWERERLTFEAQTQQCLEKFQREDSGTGRARIAFGGDLEFPKLQCLPAPSCNMFYKRSNWVTSMLRNLKSSNQLKEYRNFIKAAL